MDQTLSPPHDQSSTDPSTDVQLLAAIRDLDAAVSLTGVLDVLVRRAANEASRAAVLIVRGRELQGWRFSGFPTLGEQPGVRVPIAQSGLIAEALRSRTIVTGKSGLTLSAPSFAELAPATEMFAIALTVEGQAVAVLYADAMGDEPGRAGLLHPPMLETMARHAARCLEAVTARAMAKLLTSQVADAPAMPEDALPEARFGTSVPDAESGEDSEDHEAARRYARLLVSEIKLYHEPAIIAGRREHDLASRLGGEIARARVLYEQRVPVHVRLTTDYLDAQLVNMLADGDASLLVRSS